MDDALTHTSLSFDKDARIGHKSVAKPFFGTKEHIGIESETGLVCAAVVSSGEKTDDKYLEVIVEQSRNNGLDVEEVIADKAYCTHANMDIAHQDRVDEAGNPMLDEDGNPAKNFTLYSEIHKNVTNVLDKNNGFAFNKDSGTMTCPLSARDLLNRMERVYSNITPTMRTENSTETFHRYIALSFTYNFDAKSKKDKK